AELACEVVHAEIRAIEAQFFGDRLQKRTRRCAYVRVRRWYPVPEKEKTFFSPARYLRSFNAASVSSGRRRVAAVRFSRRCTTDDVPAIRRIFGARRSNQAMAICAGVARSRCATSDR